MDRFILVGYVNAVPYDNTIVEEGGSKNADLERHAVDHGEFWSGFMYWASYRLLLYLDRVA